MRQIRYPASHTRPKVGCWRLGSSMTETLRVLCWPGGGKLNNVGTLSYLQLAEM